jgi:hypothetical protein
VLARMDSELMLELSKATKKDSTSMMQVATMTLIYLPGSFMAVIFFGAVQREIC